MNRRTLLVSGAAAAATISAPFVHSVAAKSANKVGPVHPTEGAINIGDAVKGYRVDSLRHHSINAYWIKGPDGTTAIDAYWRIPEAKQALGNFAMIVGRPASNIAAIAITHPHTDHYGGLATFQAASGGAPAIASQTVHRVIRNDEHGFYANRLKDFPGDIPDEIPVPEAQIVDGKPIEVAGIVLEPTVLRDNEALETALLYAPDHKVLFTADVVNNKTTPVFYQGSIDGWLSQLRSLRRRFPEAKVIAPGHGAPGDFETLVKHEIAYLETFRGLIEEQLIHDGRIGPDGVTRIKSAIVDAFPDWRTSAGVPTRDRLIELNIGWTLRGWRIGNGSEAGPRAFRPSGE